MLKLIKKILNLKKLANKIRRYLIRKEIKAPLFYPLNQIKK